MIKVMKTMQWPIRKFSQVWNFLTRLSDFRCLRYLERPVKGTIIASDQQIFVTECPDEPPVAVLIPHLFCLSFNWISFRWLCKVVCDVRHGINVYKSISYCFASVQHWIMLFQHRNMTYNKEVTALNCTSSHQCNKDGRGTSALYFSNFEKIIEARSMWSDLEAHKEDSVILTQQRFNASATLSFHWRKIQANEKIVSWLIKSVQQMQKVRVYTEMLLVVQTKMELRHRGAPTDTENVFCLCLQCFRPLHIPHVWIQTISVGWIFSTSKLLCHMKL